MKLSIAEARTISHGLMSTSLKEHGLLEAIRNIIEDYNSTTPIKFSLKHNGIDKADINDKTKFNLYRIIQEITTNTVKHSKAKSARMNFTISKNMNLLKVNISDDGIGMNLKKNEKFGKGIGIINIINRIKILGGTIKIDSAPGKGTAYSFTVSLWE